MFSLLPVNNFSLSAPTADMAADAADTVAIDSSLPAPLQQPTLETLPPLLVPSLGISTRLIYYVRLWAFRLFVSGALALNRRLRPLSPSSLPTFTKTYPVRPTLTNRVFIPKTYKAGDALLPLYLDVHGGGFALCDPQVDDAFCADWKERLGCVVVSIDYSKSPSYSFPTPVYDVAAIAAAVIEDESLPIDKSRLAIGGFSAGGNLSLAALQLPELKGKVKAVVPWYPVLDWTINGKDKMKCRPYREGETDLLASSGKLFDYGYINDAQDRRDPLLSVGYAKKEDLPPAMFMVAAQYDMLSGEARDMVAKLAGVEKAQRESNAWEEGNYRWRLVEGVIHGFTHAMGKSGPAEEVRKEKSEVVFAEVAAWLRQKAFTS